MLRMGLVVEGAAMLEALALDTLGSALLQPDRSDPVNAPRSIVSLPREC